MYYKALVLLFALMFSSVIARAEEDPYVDSLKSLLNTSISDKERVRVYSDLAEYIVDEKIWMYYNKKALLLARKKLKSAKGKQRRFYRIAMADAYNNYGFYYDNHENKDQALRYYFRALNIHKEENDKEGSGGVLNNIGVLLTNQGDHEEAHDYLTQALQIKLELDPNESAKNYLNLGVNYDERGDTASAMRNYRLALQVAQQQQDHEDIATVYNNIGSIFHGAQQYDSAIPYLSWAVHHYHLYGDEVGEIWASANLGSSFLLTNQEDSAYYYLSQAYEASQYYDIPRMDEMIAEKMYMYFKVKKNWKNALVFFETQSELKDSLSNVKAQKEALRQKLKYDNEVDKARLKAKQKADIDRNRQQIWFVGIVAGLLVIFLLVVYSRLRITRKQKRTIEKQKDEIQVKNSEIVDSMTSAKRLQEAMLPSEEEILGDFEDGMLLYLPKDIVAGDFYWSHKDGLGNHYFAVADCTGHGVPGALMSVACSNALDQALKENPNGATGAILDRTNDLVISYFEAKEEKIKNGMDIAFCKWSQASKQLQYSGAYNPLWIWDAKNEEWNITKADRQPIGNFEKRKNFTTNNLLIQNESWLYIFSDGFHDQFGGESGKKLKTKGFKDVIESNVYKSGEEQKEALESFFDSWKGKEEQIDDVCILGSKLS